ncbi:MAG: hypothetical protein WDZ39_01155 [Candidatus Spechtbacterales bacterium]
MKRLKKIKAWHLVPIALLALIAVAVYVHTGRSGFSSRDVVLRVDGASQMESGQIEEFSLVVENNSSRTLENLNFSLELSSGLELRENRNEIFSEIESVEPHSEATVKFSVSASSAEERESINARLDYSPSEISARFVSKTRAEIIIGRLDVSIIFDLPQNVYADQEVRGTVHLIPHSDIETSPLYLQLTFPQGFEVHETSDSFDFDSVWRVESLQKDRIIKREFRGRLSSYEGTPEFKASLGRLEGFSFVPLNIEERTIEISDSPLVLEQTLIHPQRDVVNPGDTVSMRVSFSNQADVPFENGILRVLLPSDTVDMSSVSASGATFDEDTGTLEWDRTSLSALRFSDTGEGGDVAFSFDVESPIIPRNVNDSNKTINIDSILRSDKESLALGGALLQAENTLSLKISSVIDMEQEVYREGGEFENTGPHPPEEDTLSTYTVRWTLFNTTNAIRSAKVEAVVPSYVIWQDEFIPEDEDIRYISSTNTIVWDPGSLNVGTGYIYPEKEIEFTLGVLPDEDEIENIEEDLVLFEQVKATGIDIFTNALVEKDLDIENEL